MSAGSGCNGLRKPEAALRWRLNTFLQVHSPLGIVYKNTHRYSSFIKTDGAQMHTAARLAYIVAYLAALGLVLALHAYALHLDETSEIAAPNRVSTREA